MNLTPEQKQAAKPMPPFIRPLRDAIRHDLKTQTRRLSGLDGINERPDAWTYEGQSMNGGHVFFDNDARIAGHEPSECVKVIRCPYGEPGEIRYLREPLYSFNKLVTFTDDDASVLAENGDLVRWRWQRGTLPQIHLPKIYARTFCKMISIRCERAQDISEKDGKAEGTKLAIGKEIQPEIITKKMTHAESFQLIWRIINGHASWDKNPFVWVLTFARLKEK